MKVKRESAEHVAWDISQSESSDVVHLCGGVERKKTLHDDLIHFDAESICNTLGEETEDLGR